MRALPLLIGTLAAAISPVVIDGLAFAQSSHAGHGAMSASARAEQGQLPAAVPTADSDEHAGHSPLYFGALLMDQNELRSTGRGHAFYAWEGSAYYGTDYHRIWLNSRGESASETGSLERAELQVLYSRLLSYYWDIQVGVRHDFQIKPNEGTPARTYGVLSLQGLLPGYFEVQAQAFVSEKGILTGRLAVSYDLLITNRLILQPEAELNVSSGWDRDALISPGFYRTEVGVRLRYEVTREFAPYIGYSFESYNGGSTGLARNLGQSPRQSTFVAGVRLFF